MPPPAPKVRTRKFRFGAAVTSHKSFQRWYNPGTKQQNGPMSVSEMRIGKPLNAGKIKSPFV